MSRGPPCCSVKAAARSDSNAIVESALHTHRNLTLGASTPMRSIFMRPASEVMASLRRAMWGMSAVIRDRTTARAGRHQATNK